MQQKGIFCLEGMWDTNLKHKSTVEPILNLLELNGGVQFIHHDVATVEELEFYLSKWRMARYRNYPILYLAFHGEDEALLIGETEYTLDQLGDLLKEACSNCIVVLASCRTLKTDRRNIKRFLRKTDALAICGYKSRVNWMLAAAFELIVLSTLQEIHFSGRGIGAMERRVSSFGNQFIELDFTIMTRRELHAPRQVPVLV